MSIISNEIPEIFYECKKRFGVEWEDVIITYYPHIHAKNPIPRQKYIHELSHIQQQEKDVKQWWARYLQDDEFRLHEELEAYRNEIAFIMEEVKDRNLRYKLIRQIQIDLASPMYGSLVTLERAKELLS